MRTLLKLFLLLTAVIAPSCSRTAGNGRELRIAFLRGPSAVQMIRLADSLASGADCSWKVSVCDSPLRLRTQMINGEVDLAVLPTTMASLLYNKGVDYRLAAVPIWGSLYLCGTDASLGSLADLRGRRVNVMGRGSAPEVIFRHLLKCNGLDPEKDLELDSRFPTHIELANAAIAGRSPLFILPEPYVSQALRANPDLHILLDLASEWRKTTGAPLAGTALLCKGALSGNPELMRVLDACRLSSEWVCAHPDSAAALSVKHSINPDSASVYLSIPRSGFDFVRAADAENEINCYLRVFLQASPDAVGGRLPDENFILR